MGERWDAARQALEMKALEKRRREEVRAAIDGDQPDGPDLLIFALGFTIGAAIAGFIVYALLEGWFA